MAGLGDATPWGAVGSAAVGGLSSILSFANTLIQAKKQNQRANTLESQIPGMQKDPLSKYYAGALNNSEAMATQGLPDYQLAKQGEDADYGTALKAIQAMSPNGATAVNAISRALYAQNSATNKLNMADAATRAGNQAALGTQLNTVGAVDQNLQAQLTQRKIQAQKMVEALRDAATNNQQTGISGVGNAVQVAAGGIGKAIDIGSGADQSTNLLAQLIAKGYTRQQAQAILAGKTGEAGSSDPIASNTGIEQ